MFLQKILLFKVELQAKAHSRRFSNLEN